MRFDKNYNSYVTAYSYISFHVTANPEIKQFFINGHFCYVFKFSIIINGLGIIWHISLYNKYFMKVHTDIIVDKKSDSSDKDKCTHDFKILILTWKDLFNIHPLITLKIFLNKDGISLLPQWHFSIVKERGQQYSLFKEWYGLSKIHLSRDYMG